MFTTVIGFLIVGAFVLSLGAISGKISSAPAVLLLSIIELLRIIPKG